MNTEIKPKAKRRRGEKNLLKRNGWYYFRQMINGKAVAKSLETKDPAIAKSERDRLMREQKGDARIAALGALRPAPCATIAQIRAAYVEKWRIPANRVTRRVNMAAFENIVRHGLHLKDIDDIRLADITPATITAWRTDFLESYEESDHEEMATGIFSANSLWNKAKATFAHREAFAGLNLGPGLDALLKTPNLRAEMRTEFTPFTHIEGAALDAALDTLRATDPHLYLAAGMMLYCGLRPIEANHAHREWIETDPAPCPTAANGDPILGPFVSRALNITIRPYFKPKWTLRRTPIPTHFSFELVTLGGADWLCTPGLSKTMRSEYAQRRLTKWLKEFLPGRQAYDLRKQFGSCIAEQQGLWAAQVALGHQSINTTQKWYVRKVHNISPVNITYSNR